MEKRELVLKKLNEYNINYELTLHPKIMTIEEMNNLKIDPDNEIVKNLFLCDDKRRNFILVVLNKNKKINLKELGEMLGLKHLSFASEIRLKEILGLNKGEVTPLSVINDNNHIVKIYLDSDIKYFKKVGVHPNDNTATVWISPEDLNKYIKQSGNYLTYIKI